MRTALLSVYNKDGILELARFLSENGWRIISTGGTAVFLRESGIAIIEVSEITGFSECLGGRVKTLHPAVYAGILARRDNSGDDAKLAGLGIKHIDLVCVNLYPFVEKAAAGLSREELIEFIDIGGPAMLRAAAKNARDVIALCNTEDYAPVIAALREDSVPICLRTKLAAKVFTLTARYDAAVADYLLNEDVGLLSTHILRYGENSHQKAKFYIKKTGSLAEMEQLGGKALSYNNIRDLDAAWKCVCAFGLDADGTLPVGADEVRRFVPVIDDAPRPACVAVKHNTPCGAALGMDAKDAFERARDSDKKAIFGGVVAFNTPVTEEAAFELSKIFLEIIAAPEFEDGALKILSAKKNLRLLRIRRAPNDEPELISVDGGFLVQEPQRRLLEKWDIVSKTPLDAALVPSLLFGQRLVNFVKSNAIVCVRGLQSVGIGGGSVSRITAARHALFLGNRDLEQDMNYNADSAAKSDISSDHPYNLISKPYPLILASDAFFPFSDVVEAAAEAGVAAIIQPGGSENDAASITACDKHNIPMVFTGIRCFKH